MLKTGMFWLNDEKGLPVEEAVIKAGEYFRKTRGEMPNCVEVNPQDNASNVEVVIFDTTSIVVLNNRAILPNHLLMGVVGNGEV